MTESENTRDLMWQLEQELGVKGPANVLRAALKLAKETAAQVKETGPPAPPAWMDEVAQQALRMAPASPTPVAPIIERALRLALERRHVVEPRPVPSDEEMLIAARDDVAQRYDARAPQWSQSVREGDQDDHDEVQAAHQARRNMLREGGAVAAPVVPAVDWEAALKRAWDAGWRSVEYALEAIRSGGTSRSQDDVRSDDVSRILSTLPTQEA
ncbi:hypothetical protein [Methylobacterium sp. Gmos1]